MRSRRMGREGYEVSVRETRNAYKILDTILEWKELAG